MPMQEPATRPRFLSKALSATINFLRNGSLEIIFLLLILGNFFIKMRLILAIYMFLYFADKWHVSDKLINKLNDKNL